MDILLPLLGCSFIHLFCSWNADPNESSLFPQLDPPLRSKKEQKQVPAASFRQIKIALAGATNHQQSHIIIS